MDIDFGLHPFGRRDRSLSGRICNLLRLVAEYGFVGTVAGDGDRKGSCSIHLWFFSRYFIALGIDLKQFNKFRTSIMLTNKGLRRLDERVVFVIMEVADHCNIIFHEHYCRRNIF